MCANDIEPHLNEHHSRNNGEQHHSRNHGGKQYSRNYTIANLKEESFSRNHKDQHDDQYSSLRYSHLLRYGLEKRKRSVYSTLEIYNIADIKRY